MIQYITRINYTYNIMLYTFEKLQVGSLVLKELK